MISELSSCRVIAVKEEWLGEERWREQHLELEAAGGRPAAIPDGSRRK